MNASTISLPEIAGSIGVCSVCLDPQTHMAMSQFLSLQPGAFVSGNINRYMGSEREIGLALEEGGTRVCLLDLDANPAEANQAIERLQAERPDIFVIAVSGSSDPELIVAAMRNGCTDFLSKPLRQEALHTALRRVEIKQRERSHKGQNRGKVISVIGAKGGTGATTLALHLALNLVRQSGKKCLLVDQHPALGDSSLYLGVGRHKYSFYELVGHPDRLDEELLHGFVLHHDSGLDLLDSPESVDFSAYATPAGIAQTISFLAEYYQYVVVDCPPGLSDTTLSTLCQSDQVAIVLTAELPAVRNALRYTDYLSKLGVNPANLLLVLNRYSKKGPLGDEQLQKTLQHPIGIRVPNSYAEVIRSINAGTPVETARKSEFGAAISSWCQNLIAQSPAEDEKVKKSSGKIQTLLNR
jgi:pilus assembly protein CpaE